MNIVEVNHLKKYYGRHRGVEDVHFTIKQGEVFGFIGPNGAGKSTTIRCALSLIFPTSGKITLFGLDSIKDQVEIAKRVGYLPSEVAYYDNMKVKDLLEYSMSFYGRPDPARLKDLCERMDLDISRKIDDLSLGNKKKVGIVQGLLHRPSLIILDEPTSGLDPLMQQRFFDLIEEENKRGATVLFSSHILSEVKRLSDRIALIKDGRIEDMDQIASLQSNHYKNVQLTADPEALDRFEGSDLIEVKQRFGDQLHFIYRGEINRLLRELARFDVQNLSMEDPSLEELFMDYYERPNNEHVSS
ncbi:MAG TPA: ABC transporter ATP-binding protein [Tissierellia bacterium]|nr:ABC transporter ATP-binding protein [Tissierellia bacterium]